MQYLDHLIGLDKLKLLFFNDSKTDFMAQTDIHAKIGQGKMGLNTFKYFLADKRLKHIPIILETPDPTYWKYEIESINKESTPCLN